MALSKSRLRSQKAQEERDKAWRRVANTIAMRQQSASRMAAEEKARLEAEEAKALADIEGRRRAKALNPQDEALTGAAIGSSVLPGWGTLAGATIGQNVGMAEEFKERRKDPSMRLPDTGVPIGKGPSAALKTVGHNINPLRVVKDVFESVKADPRAGGATAAGIRQGYANRAESGEMTRQEELREAARQRGGGSVTEMYGETTPTATTGETRFQQKKKGGSAWGETPEEEERRRNLAAINAMYNR